MEQPTPTPENESFTTNDPPATDVTRPDTESTSTTSSETTPDTSPDGGGQFREYVREPLLESKRSCRARLQQSGQWEQAVTLRESIRKDLVGRGWPLEWAVHEAWRQMQTQYPSGNERKTLTPGRRERIMTDKPPQNDGDVKYLDPEVAKALESRPQVDFVEEVRWVKDNLRDPRIQPLDAPSRGAWNILCEVRDDPKFRQDFLKNCFTHLIKREDKPEETESEETQSLLKSAEEVRALIGKKS